MSKRIVFCFDGTWNRLSVDNPTNVVLLAQMVKPIASDGTAQTVYYDEGIGTNEWFLKRWWQGAFGKGMLGILREAYRFLIFNYEPGDEIFIFGFSRGAFTARSFAGFIRHAGILDAASASKIDRAIEIYRSAPAGKTGTELQAALDFRYRFCKSVCVSAEDYEYRVDIDEKFDRDTPILNIRYLGVWDTVRALGVPDFLPFSQVLNRRYGYHNAVLTSKIKAARHAIALDEKRPTFPPTVFGRDKIQELIHLAQSRQERAFEDWDTPYQERWFPGVHGAVGGGGDSRGLSDASLHWVLSGARRAGLELRGEESQVVFGLRPNPFAPIFNDPPSLWKRFQAFIHGLFGIARPGPCFADEIAHTTYRRFHQDPDKTKYEPKALRQVTEVLDNWPYANPIEWSSHDGAELEDYCVTNEDTLSILARERLHDPKRWPFLFELNRDLIEDPDYVPTGLTIRIPPKRSADDAALN